MGGGCKFPNGFSLVELCIATLIFVTGALAAVKLTGVYLATLITLDEQQMAFDRLTGKQAELTLPGLVSALSSGTEEVVTSDNCAGCQLELHWQYQMWTGTLNAQGEMVVQRAESGEASLALTERAPPVAQLIELNVTAEWQSHNGRDQQIESGEFRFHPLLEQPDLWSQVNLGPVPTQ